MLLTITKRNPDSTLEFNVTMSEGECNYLVNFAIESLIQLGSIAVQDNEDGPQTVMVPTIERDVTEHPDTVIINAPISPMAEVADVPKKNVH